VVFSKRLRRRAARLLWLSELDGLHVKAKTLGELLAKLPDTVRDLIAIDD